MFVLFFYASLGELKSDHAEKTYSDSLVCGLLHSSSLSPMVVSVYFSP